MLFDVSRVSVYSGKSKGILLSLEKFGTYQGILSLGKVLHKLQKYFLEGRYLGKRVVTTWKKVWTLCPRELFVPKYNFEIPSEVPVNISK